VANAVGAVAGSVVSTCEAIVYARMRDVTPIAYIAQVGDSRRSFARQDEALDYARSEAWRQAEAGALLSGAAAPHTQVVEIPNGVHSVRLRAQAVGNPRLMAEKAVAGG
jgi:hypothetical protein